MSSTAVSFSFKNKHIFDPDVIERSSDVRSSTDMKSGRKKKYITINRSIKKPDTPVFWFEKVNENKETTKQKEYKVDKNTVQEMFKEMKNGEEILEEGHYD